MRLKPQAHFFYFFIVIYKFKTLSIVHLYTTSVYLPYRHLLKCKGNDK